MELTRTNRLICLALAVMVAFPPPVFAQADPTPDAAGFTDLDGDGGPDPGVGAPAGSVGGPYLAGRSRVLVVTNNVNIPAGQEQDVEREKSLTTSILDGLGMYYDLRDSRVLKTEWCRTGIVPNGDGTVTNYGAVIWLAAAPSVFKNGVRHDSLRVMRLGLARCGGGSCDSWPSVPQLMIGPPGANYGGSMWSNGANVAADTTGIEPIALSVPAVSNRIRTVASTDDPKLEWQAWDAMNAIPFGEFDLVPPDTTGPGTLRNMVSFRLSAWATPAANLGSTDFTGGRDQCDYCFGTRSNRLPQDTTVFWIRYRDNLTTSAPWMFVWPMGGNGALFSTGLVAGAVAEMDSICRARGDSLIGAVPGWKPLKMAISLTGFAQASSEAVVSSDYSAAGIGTASDSTLIRAAVKDSAASLGVKLNPDWSPDSSAAYAYQIRWLEGLPFWKVAMRPMTGSTGSPNVLLPSTTTGKYATTDPFGHIRDGRTWLDASWPPAATDSTTDALLYWARVRRDSIPRFAGHLQSALLAGNYDYIPAQYNNRQVSTGVDSFATAINRAGFTVAVIAPDNSRTAPGSHRVQQSNGTWADMTAGDLQGFTASERTIPVRDPITSPSPQASVRLVATRAPIREDIGHVLNLSHNWGEEFFWGFWRAQGPWYMGDMEGYYHTFRTHLSVFSVPIATLGCTHGNGNDGVARRLGWPQLKSVVNQVKWINARAGRTVIEICYLEDLAK